MTRFPRDVPRERALKALASLGFEVVRSGNHISLSKTNADGTVTPMTLPNHARIKAWTLLEACGQAGIGRDEFIAALRQRR